MRIERLSVKGSSPWNEDALLFDEQRHIYGVIDGATSLVPYTAVGGETGGYLSSRIIASNLYRNLCEAESNDIPLQAAMVEANRALRSEMLAAGIDVGLKEQLWSAGAVIVRISDTSVEFAQAGDCMLTAVYKDGTIRIVTRDQLAHIDGETYKLWAEGVAQGLTQREQLWEHVKPQIVNGRQMANTPNGYAVLNGEPEAEGYLEYGCFNRINLKALLLMTDGMYVPKRAGEALFDATEVTAMVQRAGLEEYVRGIVGLEESDPDCLAYPRVKKSDDKTAIWITL